MWIRGKINQCWDESYKKLNFVRQPLPDDQIKIWQDQGYTNTHFNGLMYDNTNPMPVWTKKIADEIGLTNYGFVIYKMPPGIIMPSHVDHFTRYQKIFQTSVEKVFRAIVFLEDWKSGHYFEINNNPIINYNAGEYVLWSHEEPHIAANIGTADRYTLQITGVRI